MSVFLELMGTADPLQRVTNFAAPPLLEDPYGTTRGPLINKHCIIPLLNMKRVSKIVGL
jgi:hypothetical protein